jgi:Tfp pilus assembly protein PilE
VSSIATSCIVFACVFGGALLGMLLRNLLPEHHLDPDSRNVVNLGMALIGTMTALVLGLLIASAKSSYDTQKSEVTQMAADIVQLDRILGRYGAEANGARAVLRRAVLSVDQSWSEDAARSERLDSAQVRTEAASFYDKIQELTPSNDFEHSLQSQALQTALEIGHTRSLLVEQAGSSIPMPFLVVMVFWLAVIFASFGLFAPRNATVIATLFVCALSVSGAIFLILELDSPFSGLLQISDAPLRNAIAHIGM